jgi:hypothetical protein
MNPQWKPDINAFIHICPVCHYEHHGRKNKLYCSLACKARHNNDLASERRERHLAVSAAHIRNGEILAEAMSFHRDAIPVVPMQSLLNKGFDPQAPTTRGKMEDGIWHLYGDFAIQVVEVLNQVRIRKIK